MTRWGKPRENQIPKKQNVLEVLVSGPKIVFSWFTVICVVKKEKKLETFFVC